MKSIAIAAVIAGLAVSPAAAGETAPAKPAKKSLCLRVRDIDHTHVVDKNTILFYMRGGKIWKNTLLQPCPGLMWHGFTEVTHDGTICSNMHRIQILVTGQVCLLGRFTPYTPPPKEKPAADKH